MRHARVSFARGGQLRPGVLRLGHVVGRGHHLRSAVRALALHGRHHPGNVQQRHQGRVRLRGPRKKTYKYVDMLTYAKILRKYFVTI